MSGGEKYMLTMAQCLSGNHTVSLFWDQEEDIRKKASFRFGLSLEKVSFTRNIFSKSVSSLSRVIESAKFDVIIILSDGSIPVVQSKLYVHFQSPMQWVKGDTFKNKLKLLRISKFICNSKFTKSYIDKTFGVDSVVLYPPVEIPQKGKSIHKENIILNVGRFGINQAGSSYKKQDMLVESFIEMVQKGLKNWKFVLVTSIAEQDREELNKLQKKASGFPIEFIINPGSDVLWEQYKKAKLYWHAAGFGENLQHHPDRAEHFGISTVEAMGCGAVPIVINAGGQKEIVEDGENGLLWDTSSELIQKTRDIIKNPSLMEQLSKNARKKAQQFNKEHFCEKIHGIIT